MNDKPTSPSADDNDWDDWGWPPDGLEEPQPAGNVVHLFRPVRPKPLDGTAGAPKPNAMLDAALDYARRRWPVFPVGTNKKPLTTHGVGDATTNPKQIKEWWARWPEANIAVEPGGCGMMVLDLDPGWDPEVLATNLGSSGLPDTKLVASTPRGGAHHWYQLDAGEVVAASASKLAPHVDVRSHHSYVLVPPSHTKDGDYVWASEGKPSRRSDALINLANVGRDRHEDHDNWLIEADLPENVDLARDWLKNKARVAVEGEGGDHLTYATAAMMKSHGISEATALDLMLEHWNPRCDPPWDPEDLAEKVRNGYAYNTSPPGNVTPAYHAAGNKAMFAPVGDAGQRAVALMGAEGRYAELLRYFEGVLMGSGERQRCAVRFGDIVDAPSVPWIIDGWLPQDGVAILFGESESFKTYMVIHKLLCVATGRPYANRDGFKGYAVGDPRPVILFAGESYGGIVQRVNAAIKGGGFDRKLVEQNLVLVPDVYSLNRADGLAGMADEIEALDVRPAIVAVDTLNLALDGNEDSAEDIKRALRGLRALVSRFGAAGLLIDHVGHGDKAHPRGSSAKKANADVMILCERDGDTSNVTLMQMKNRDDDKTKYETAFYGETVNLGTSGTNLHFRAVAPRTNTSERKAARELIERDIHVRYILAALRSARGRTWKLRELAEEARRKGCIIPFDTLRKSVLTTQKGKRGWALDHPALAPYRDPHTESWVTPPELGPIKPRWELKDDDYQ